MKYILLTLLLSGCSFIDRGNYRSLDLQCDEDTRFNLQWGEDKVSRKVKPK